MYSKYLKNSSVRAISSAIAVVLALLLQGMVTQASASEIDASFERMLNPVEAAGQPAVAYRAERDPLYTMVSATLWSAPTGDYNIAAGFEHMLNPVETAAQPAVAYRAERDPLYTMVNVTLWNTPTSDDNIWATFLAYAQP